tara:strand:- start:7777 stop:10170 length:2394 start_codon:yes stop_codon:yes gene_type:complete
MRIKTIIFITIILITQISFSISQEVKFEAKKIDITKNGNIIIAKETNTKIPSEKIEIYSDDAIYYKNDEIINFNKNVNLRDFLNNLIINSNSITYKKKEDLIYSDDETSFNIDQIYTIKSRDVTFNRKLNIIYSDEGATIKDTEENTYILKEKYVFDLNKETIRAKSATILDANDNKYIFEDLIIKLKSNEIAGKEVKVEFEDSYFGNIKNNPELKGRSAYSNENELKLYKAVFSTCNIENKKCRGWELSSEEFNHDKINKIFEYKNSWLKIFDFKTFYMPYFNHPDPTVKRKSGFLTPSYSTSESLGISLMTPYFKIIDVDKDITFSPRYYGDKSFLLQNEYRQALEYSNILSDFSFLIGKAGSKGHFFYNQVGTFNSNLSYEFNLQEVKGDNYLKTYKLLNSSPLITDDNLLLSNFDINRVSSNSKFNSSFKVYEDLSRGFHDRYQYIFPEFNFEKNIKIPENYKGSFTFNSSGYNKNYNTNINETVLINDFLFNSNNYVNNNGLKSNYQLLLKNTNSYSNNSNVLEENENYEIYETLKLDTAFPLKKKIGIYTDYLTPRVSMRYSPNGNTDISSKDLQLNYNNAFNLNRISTNSQVEGGKSATLGLEFQRNHKELGNLFEVRLGNVLKDKENLNLPHKSKLNKTRSDIFGDLSLKYNDMLNFGYNFSYDKDLKYSNLDNFSLGLQVNNIVSNFNYYMEDHDFGDSENITNNTIFNVNNENNLEFSTAKNLRDNFTQYYNLIYSYNTDCLSINLNYNKSFYSDGSLEPDETLSFLVKIIPFTEIGVSNFGNFIGK